MQLRRLSLVLLFAIVVFPITVLAQIPKIGDDGNLKWMTDSKAAFEQAKASNKPVLVYVWSERGDEKSNPFWHAKTHGMWKDDAVAHESERFVCLSIDADSAEPFVERCKTERAQVFFTDPSGRTLKKFTGRDGGLWIEFQPDDVLEAMRKVRWPRS